MYKYIYMDNSMSQKKGFEFDGFVILWVYFVTSQVASRGIF